VTYTLLDPRLSLTPLDGAAIPPPDYVPTVLGAGTTQFYQLRLLNLGDEARVELGLQGANERYIFSFVVAMANTGLEIHRDGYPVLASFATNEFYPNVIRNGPDGLEAVDGPIEGSPGSLSLP
jgi:hypothetical protein